MSATTITTADTAATATTARAAQKSTSTTPLRAAVLDTPPGPLAVIVDDDRIVAAGYTADLDSLHRRLDARRRDRPLERTDDLGPISAAIQRYHDGDLAAIDDLVVDQPGTPQQQAIWQALREIPAGTTLSYGELAQRAGSPNAVRAAGTACGRNLVAPIVPCHRAVRRDGTLGGYYYGLDVKRWLLDHEARSHVG